MSARRLPALLLALLAAAPGAARSDEGAEPNKPSPALVDEARMELAGEDPDRLLARFESLEVVRRSGDAEFVPLLLDAALRSQLPAFAVEAGRVAHALDPKAALRAYDAAHGKLRRLPLAQAARYLGEIRTKETVRRLGELAKGGETEARVEALYGLVKQQDPSGHSYLLGGLKDKKVEVRIPAAICCGLARVAEADDLLVRGLEDAGDHYAFFCAWALGQLRQPGLLERVAGTLRGRTAGDVGFAKAKAVLECAFDPKTHVPLLVKLLRSSNEDAAAAAAVALGRIGEESEEAADALLSLVFNARSEVLAHCAVDALGRVGSPEHGRKLLARYANNPAKAPPHGVKALGLLRVPEAADLLLQLAYRSKSVGIQKRAAIAFWQCAGEEARAAFRKQLLEESAAKRLESGCIVLGFDRSEAGFQFAVDLLRRHYGKKTVRSARDALESMTGHRFAPEPGIWRQWLQQNADFFDRKPQFLDREQWRKQLLENKLEMGISPKTEAAVEFGLAWLARHQELDGRWSGDRFTERCSLYYRKKCQVGARLGGWDVGMTGIALLAFYGAGYRPTDGRYSDTVLRAQVYCAVRQWADGDFGGQGDLIGGYTRPIATIALAEAYGTTQDREYMERARASVEHIVRIQYEDAGWRYRLGGQFPGDTSVTGWNAWAIATARKFGIPVDPMGLDGANSLIDRFSSPVTEDEEFYNTDPRYFFEVGRGQEFEHFTGYNAVDETRPPMTAIGLICKIFMGRQRSHPYCIGAANRLLRSIPEYDDRGNKIKYTAGSEYPSYYWYYGSLAMYQMGGRFWRRWSRPLLTEAIPNTQIRGDQCEHGSWESFNLDSIGGRVYVTSMCVLTLETFYRYLPALQLK